MLTSLNRYFQGLLKYGTFQADIILLAPSQGIEKDMKGNLMKRSAIQKIYKNYFDIIESYFGSIKHYLGDSQDSHIDLGIHMANYPLISDLILDSIHDLDTAVFKFWDENARILFDYTREQSALKCLYSGDITPVVLENFVKKSALYIDTVVIPDPIFNLSLFPKELYVNKKYFLAKLIRHVFNIWKLKDLLLADSKERYHHNIAYKFAFDR